MSTQHIREAQKLAPDALVELYQLDTSMLTNIYGVAGTGSVYHWCPGTINGNATVVMGGVSYPPMPIEVTDLEWNGQGRLPQPKLRIDNTGGLATGLVIQFGDMLGAQITRQRTFAKFLDGQANADPTAVFDPDIFYINRKSWQGKAYVEFELAAQFDQLGLKLPRRQVIRDSCHETYRVYKGGVFHAGTCPWAGTSGAGPYFDASETQVFTPDQDTCSHKLTGCLIRFGNTTDLPFGGFPGVALTAVQTSV